MTYPPPNKCNIDGVIKFSVVVLPFGAMLHAHLVNGVLFSMALVSMYVVFRNRLSFFGGLKEEFPYLAPVLVAFYITPIIGVFLGQLFRCEFSWPNYDSPSRFLLCLPIFVLLYHVGIDVVKYLRFSLPGALLFAVLFVHLGPTIERADGRLSVYSVDLLTFGSMSLTFGLLSLVCIGVFSPFRSKTSLLFLFGFFSGLYLSVCSGSRTGWLALPVVIVLWGVYAFRKNYIAVFVCLALLFCFIILSYVKVQPVRLRINNAIHDVKSYRWSGPNAETSLGERISFYRIGFSLFLQRPASGWGDRGFANSIRESDSYQFASQSTREGVIRCGFHNEIMTNAIRSGIWGALSSLLLFVVPGLVFIRALCSQADLTKKYGLLGLSYVVCIFISSMSTEVFNLKYTASFHALMLSFLMATTLSMMTGTKRAKNGIPSAYPDH